MVPVISGCRESCWVEKGYCLSSHYPVGDKFPGTNSLSPWLSPSSYLGYFSPILDKHKRDHPNLQQYKFPPLSHLSKIMEIPLSFLIYTFPNIFTRVIDFFFKRGREFRAATRITVLSFFYELLSLWT